ncbi:MAG: hypothetical protein MUC43_01915 [Pirellula sp.]|nr:hypothetical protein [Pirellula sp.]
MLVATFCVAACIATSHAQIVGAPPRYMSATPNFTVYANDADWAKEVSTAAESFRKALAIHWTGNELPQWSKPCILFVQDNPRALASGETNYTLVNGAVINFKMTVRGTRERIIDSVLPHEVTHTIIASHFAPYGRPVPRWADEGMCTTVEHEAERRKHDQLLIKFLMDGKGLRFATLFLLEDYPADPLPLYAQGYSLTSFLIAQGGEQGPRTFIRFLEAGMKNNDWVAATNEVYGYPLVGKLQTAWNDWVNAGGRDVSRFTASARGFGNASLVAQLTNNNGLANIASAQPVVPAISGASSDNGMVRTASAEVPRLNQAGGWNKDGGSYYLNELRSREASGDNANPSLASAGINSPTGLKIADASENTNTNVPTNPAPNQFVPLTTIPPQMPNAIQHSVSQPRPLQTMGGSLQR